MIRRPHQRHHLSSAICDRAPLRDDHVGIFSCRGRYRLFVALAMMLTALAAPHLSKATATTSDYADEVMADSPIAYYHLDETSGTVAHDSSGNGNNGTYSGAILGQSSLIDGSADGAVGAAATSGNLPMRASIAHLPSGTAPWTIEAWFETSSDIADSTGNGVGLSNFYINVHNEQVNLIADSTTVSQVMPYSIADHKPHLLVGTYDGSNLDLYVDGQLLRRATGVTLSSSNPGLSFNTRSSTTYDEFAVYGSALSSARIHAHWTAGAVAGGTCDTTPTSSYASALLADDPLAYFRLDDVEASRVSFDSSGNCRNGVYDGQATSAAGIVRGDDGSALDPESTNSVVQRFGWPGMPGGTDPWTIEAWIQSGPITDASTNGIGLQNFYINVSGDGVSLMTDASPLTATWPSLDDGLPHMLDGTYNGSRLSLFVDGHRVGYEDAVLTSPNYGGGINNRASTTIDDLSIFGSKLTHSQIWAHYSAAYTPIAAVSTYSSSVLADDPTAYWRLDDAADGSEEDVVGSDTCTYPGEASPVSRDLGADSDNAVEIDGSGGLTCGDEPSIEGSTPFTYDIWVRTPSDATGTLMEQDSGSTNATLSMAAGQVHWSVAGSGDSGFVIANAGPELGDDAWHQIIATRTASGDGQLFVDGVLVAGAASTGTVALGGGDLTIGSGPSSADSFEGDLDEAAIYPQALSEADTRTQFDSSGDPVDLLDPSQLEPWDDETASIPYLTAERSSDGAQSVAPISGSAYGALAGFYYFQDFNALHAYAVAATAFEAIAEDGGTPTTNADLYSSALRATLDPTNELGDPLGLAGFGPKRGTARPDLVVSGGLVDTTRIYEIKFDSAYGRATGPAQLDAYVAAISGSVAGPPLSERTVEVDLPGGFSVEETVNSSPTTGLELYDIDGGRDAIKTIIAEQVAEIVSLAEQQAGDLAERELADGSVEFTIDGTAVRTLRSYVDPETTEGTVWYVP